MVAISVDGHGGRMKEEVIHRIQKKRKVWDTAGKGWKENTNV